MNLTQYRLKAAAQTRNRLWLCLAAAGVLHIGAIALIHPLIPSVPASDPIQFIAVDQPDALSGSSNSHSGSFNLHANPSRSQPTNYPVVLTVTGINQAHSPFSRLQTKTLPQAISTPQTATAKDEVWDAYLIALRRQIYQQWQSAPLVKTDRPTKVRFMVDRQGHLTHLEMIQSSRDATADQDAIRAIQTAAPFAQLPSISKEDWLRVTFTFEAPIFHE
jgi:TonB family protein